MTPPPIPRYRPDAQPAEISGALLDSGVVIVERLADDECCDRLLAEVRPWSAASPTGGDEFSGANTRRTGALLTRCPSSIAIVAHPLILEVVDRTLWSKKTTFQLHLTQSIAIGPNSAPQMLHRDQWCYDFFPFRRMLSSRSAASGRFKTSPRTTAPLASCRAAIGWRTGCESRRRRLLWRKCRLVQ